MVKLNLLAVFGDWSMGNIEKLLPQYKDENGIIYRRILWEPDDESKLAIWGSYEEFEKIAVDKKNRRTTSGDFVEVRLPQEHFYDMFYWGDRNIQFIETDFYGRDTAFSIRHKLLMTKIQSLQIQSDGMAKQIALQNQTISDLRHKKLSQTEEFIDTLDAYKKIGTRYKETKEDESDDKEE